MTREPYKVLSLFAGIGGFDLGLERTGGFKTVAFCEIDPFCRRVLAKHWPEVPCYEDVKELTGERLRADGVAVDCIVGGFPCQDISFAGKGAGLNGERSGLWFEFARLIGELRPRYVIVENVAALLSRGLGDVLGTLASLGYDAEWHCIPASAVGAHHRRDRIWIMAYSGCCLHSGELDSRTHCGTSSASKGRDGGKGETSYGERIWVEPSAGRPDVADAAGERCGEAREHIQRSSEWLTGCSQILADSTGIGHARSGLLTKWCRPETNGAREAANALSGGELGEWCAEPELGRVANGIPDRAHRLRGLGNAVVPQIPELIGRAILEAEAQ